FDIRSLGRSRGSPGPESLHDHVNGLVRAIGHDWRNPKHRPKLHVTMIQVRRGEIVPPLSGYRVARPGYASFMRKGNELSAAPLKYHSRGRERCRHDRHLWRWLQSA